MTSYLGLVPESVNARPFGSVAQNTAWDRAREARDRLAAVLTEALDKLGLRALVLKSQDGNYPAWVRLEAWLPPAGKSATHDRLRSALEIVADARPFHETGVVYAVRATHGKKSIAIEHATRFNDQDALEWALFALGRRGEPSSYHPRLDAIMNAAGTAIPLLRRDYNPLRATCRAKLLTWPLGIAAATIPVFVAAAMVPAALPMIAGILGAVCLGMAAALLWSSHRSRQVIARAAQPEDVPRRLFHVDSWHAVLSELKGDAGTLEQRIKSKLASLENGAIDSRVEVYGFRKPNGYEARERIVVSRGQGYVHVHLTRFGDDLFVGWESQLNWARWAETGPITRKLNGRAETEYRSLTPGWYVPSEVDLFDLESLGALVHHRIEREIKSVLGDRLSTLNIDFEIERGDRDRLLDQGKLLSQTRPEMAAHGVARVLGAGKVQEVSLSEMTLAPPGKTVRTGEGWLANVPPMLMLPVLVALFYVPRSLNPNLPEWQMLRSEASGFEFSALAALPLALALAVGIRVWGKARLLHAVMLVPLMLALTLGTEYAAAVLPPLLFVPGELGVPGTLAFNPLTTTAFDTFAALVAASAFATQLRRPGLWLAAIVLTCAVTAARESIAFIPWSYMPEDIATTLAVGLWLAPVALAGRATPRSVTAGLRGVTRSLLYQPGQHVRGGGMIVVIAAALTALAASAMSPSPTSAWFGYLILGLTQGSLYAVLALGIALVLRAHGIVSLMHGALFTLGMVGAWYLSSGMGLGYWPALVAVPVATGIAAAVFERTLLARTYSVAAPYGAILTLGAALVITGYLQVAFGADLRPYPNPLPGGESIGLGFVPYYRMWAIAAALGACALAQYLTQGSFSRAQAVGHFTGTGTALVFGVAAWLAAFGGILAAPIFTVSAHGILGLSFGALGAVAVAGTASFGGVVATAIALGVISASASQLAPDVAPFVPLFALALGLFLWPAGLFGDTVADRGPIPLPAGGWRGLSAVGLIALVALLGAVANVHDPFLPSVAAQTLSIAMLASGAGLVLGWLGLLPLGHAMFFGVAAYVAAISANEWQSPVALSMLAGTAAAALLAIPAGIIALRRGPIYFAISTLVLAQIVELACIKLPATGGEYGLMVSGHELLVSGFHGPSGRYLLALIPFALSVIAIAAAYRTPAIQKLLQARQSGGEQEAGTKLAVFVLSAALAGLGGATHAYIDRYVSLSDVAMIRSFEAVLMAVAGGLATLVGPILGALAATGMNSYVYSLNGSDWTMAAKGAALVVCAVYLRDGLAGLWPSALFTRRPSG